MPELDWDDLAAMDAAIDSPVHETDSIDDEALFLDTTHTGLAVTRRRLVMDRPGVQEGAQKGMQGGVKLITLMRTAPTVDTAMLAATLTGPYAAAIAASGPSRHEVLECLADRQGRPAFTFQAIDQLWFAGPADALAWTASDAAHLAARLLAGITAGSERLIATPTRIL